MPPDGPPSSAARGLTRRQAIGAGASAAGVAALGAYGLTRTGGRSQPAAADVVLRAERTTVELGPRTAETWAYNGALPGPVLRLKEGQRFRARVENHLPQPTTVHWHGIRLRNAMDGVPGVTQEPIAPGSSFDYDFVAPDAGTYLYHSHVGTQLDRGLYGALVVEARHEALAYDREALIVLDDWLDGVAGTPDAQLDRLRKQGMNMGGRMKTGNDMGAGGGPKTRGGAGRHTTLGGAMPGTDTLAGLANALERGGVDPGDVRYPLYLINGRPPSDPAIVRVRRGERLRLRIANPAADTLFCVFVEGHELTVTHADGQPVEHVRTGALVIGMGERYDVLLDARNPGAHRIIAAPLGKQGRAVATLRYADAPRASLPAAAAPYRMPSRIASYSDLVAPTESASRLRAEDTILELGMGDGRYRWTIGGQAFPDAEALRFGRGEPVRLVLRNTTMMPHPMHLHGHFFRAITRGGRGPRKDTILVPPMATTAIELVADNPGRWAFHCHNAYHGEAGMMRIVEVDDS